MSSNDIDHEAALAAYTEREPVNGFERFVLDQPDWKKFSELLDRPVQVPAGLRDLYAKPSVFE